MTEIERGQRIMRIISDMKDSRDGINLAGWEVDLLVGEFDRLYKMLNDKAESVGISERN